METPGKNGIDGLGPDCLTSEASQLLLLVGEGLLQRESPTEV